MHFGLCQKTIMKLFAKIVNGYKQKSSVNAWPGLKYDLRSWRWSSFSSISCYRTHTVYEFSIIIVNYKHVISYGASNPILAQCCIPYRNQSFDLNCKSNDWFLYGMQATLGWNRLTNKVTWTKKCELREWFYQAQKGFTQFNS